MNPTLDMEPISPQSPPSSLWEKLGGRALTVAIILHMLVIACGAFWIFQIIHQPEAPREPIHWSDGGGGPRGTDVALHEKNLKKLMPTSQTKRVVSTNRYASYVLPEQTDHIVPMSPLVSLGGGGNHGGMGGSGDGPGRGPGRGPGVGSDSIKGDHFFSGPLPIDWQKRCSKGDRLSRISDNGGSLACEDAVVKGLRWLKANQNRDGSWSGQSSVAMTGLALLAYFGHCETPASDEFGESCLSGIIYLVNIGVKNNGRIADNFTANHWSYEHAIATYALAEALVFCKEIKQSVPYLDEIATKAGQFILDHQHESGGWAYAYAKTGGHADVSVAGWQLQALRACCHTGIKFQGMNSGVNKGLKYLASCQNSNGGFGYSGPTSGVADYFSLTGVGMLCNQMWGKGGSSEVRRAAKYLLENSRFDYNSANCDLYGHYYESQAMMQRGGNDWKQYNAMFRDQLLNNQDADGSWKVPGGGQKIRAAAPSYTGDKTYRTCLCTLMLEVYYRFLSTGGSGRGNF